MQAATYVLPTSVSVPVMNRPGGGWRLIPVRVTSRDYEPYPSRSCSGTVESPFRRLRWALVQMSCVASQEANVAKAESRIAEAAAAGANIVCLQELFAGLYPCQSEDHARFGDAEPIPGPISERIAAAAARHSVVVVGSFFERRAPGLYHNTAVIYDADGRAAGMYRKMHIPDDPLYYEKFYFTPGDLGFSQLWHEVRPDWRLRLLGPVVSRGGAADGADRGRDYFLSHGHRLAPQRKSRVRRQPAFRLGNDDAQPRDRQWRVCGRRQPDGRGRGAGVLGRRRSFATPTATCWPAPATTWKRR